MLQQQDNPQPLKANDLTGLRCPKCDYDLTGLARTQCPECGHLFDPAFLLSKAREQRERPNREKTRKRVRVLFKVSAALLLMQSISYTSVLFGLLYGNPSPSTFDSVMLFLLTFCPSILQLPCLVLAWNYGDASDLVGDRPTFLKACVAGAMSLVGMVIMFLTYGKIFSF